MEKQPKGHNLTIAVNDVTLSYNDVGEGKVPILFLHGFPFDKSMWDLQLEHLKSLCRAIAVDLSGFGKSTRHEHGMSIDTSGNDIILFMDKLGIDKAIVCGLSMGGFIALNAHKKFKDRFAALILCDTNCIADTAEAKEKRFKAIGEIKAGGLTEFNEGFIKRVFSKDSFQNKKEVVEQLRSIVFQNTQDIIIQGLAALAERAETCSSLGEVRIPTLVICGKEDEVTPLAQSEFIHKNIAASTLRVIDHAGHVSNLEQPHEFNKHVLDFLIAQQIVQVKELGGNKRDEN
ncbi:MAG TPA: alpha/beta hydrolase [Flavobacteriales bacterium]|nr:alpha/beta hydrolase [Flavobacteriales bacterium]